MRQVWVGIVAALALAGGCSKSGGGDAAKVAAEARNISPQALEARAKAATDLEYPLYRRLMTVSGMDAELGGTMQGEMALQTLMAQWRDQGRGQREQVARLIRVENAPNYYGELGLTGSASIANLVAQLGGQLIGGSPAPEGEPLPKGIDVKMTNGRVEASTTTEGTTDGVTGRITTKVSYDQCPDANGQVSVTFTSDSSLGAGDAGANLKVTVKGKIHYGDDGRLGNDWNAETHIEHAAFGARSGTFVDATFADGKTTVNNKSSQATDADIKAVEAQRDAAEIMAMSVLANAERAVQSGACVKLEPTSAPGKRTGAKPRTNFVLDARPRSVIDGAAVGGTVVATLSGDGALDRAGAQVPADAQYKYVGPDTDGAGTITFEARSKRGVGKAMLKFDAKSRAYSAAGGAGAFYGTGEICDFAETFQITGSGVVVTFTPSSESGGSYSYTGNMGGVGVYGNGTYSVSVTEAGGKMTATGPGTVVTPMGRRSATDTEHYTLTPRPPC
ncbi:MAG: hypothetical protein V4466_04900 [Pseudomonadota bacterium]